METEVNLANPLLQPTFIVIVSWLLHGMGIIVGLWETADRIQDQAATWKFQDGQVFDFIVVGAGSAGCIVANRLIRSGYTVLLLEAGSEQNPLQLVPGFTGAFLNREEVNWLYRTVPQKYAALNSLNQEAFLPAGKGLGGSGNANYMIHLRGHYQDFNNWAKLTGDFSWSWEGVLPFFKRYEDYEIHSDRLNHGYGGDLRIEAPDDIGLTAEFVKAANEMGYPQVDLNAPFREGFDVIRYPIKFGRRQAPYKAFLEPILNHPRLTVLKFAHVNKVLFTQNNEAYAVEFDRHGHSSIAFAAKEVILSAGALGSPRILMSSGIGPVASLRKWNIPVVNDLPVGRNLKDHLKVHLSPFIIEEPRSLMINRDISPRSLIQWYTQGKGPLTSTGIQATGFIVSEVAKSRGERDWPDLQFQLLTGGIFPDAFEQVARAQGQKPDELRRYYEPESGNDAIHILVVASRPRSTGFLELGGPSPYDMPVIDTNYLGDSGNVDLKVLMEGVKKALYLVENTTSLGVDLGAKFTTVKLPGCEHLEFRCDSYWECFIRRYSLTNYHYVGTAAIGQVVDSRLRVFGVKRLRVMDGSIQPVLVSSNTQASIMMIGEKGAHMILEDWSKSK